MLSHVVIFAGYSTPSCGGRGRVTLVFPTQFSTKIRWNFTRLLPSTGVYRTSLIFAVFSTGFCPSSSFLRVRISLLAAIPLTKLPQLPGRPINYLSEPSVCLRLLLQVLRLWIQVSFIGRTRETEAELVVAPPLAIHHSKGMKKQTQMSVRRNSG